MPLSKSVLKEILVSNEEFILGSIGTIVPRRNVLFPETPRKVTILFGVRRSGKTFLLYDWFRKHSDRCLYIDFEDERFEGFGAADMHRIREAYLELKPRMADSEVHFLLDEIQNIIDWEKPCRRMVERENARVMVTGSSSRLMPLEIGTGLRGRSWSTEIMPFSFREHLAVRGMDPDERTIAYGRKKADVLRHYRGYAAWGGFPEVVMASSALEKSKLLREYFIALYFRDLVERYKMTNIPLLDALTSSLFSSFASKFSLSAFYRKNKDLFPVSKDTVFSYYANYLASSLICKVELFAESAHARTRNPSKVYVIDNGLCRHVASPDDGRLLENSVYLELKRRGCEVSYFDDGGECDFVARDPGGSWHAIQSCSELSEDNRQREIGGLLLACTRLGLRQGLLITAEEEAEMDRDGVSISMIPFWKWSLEG
jgi:predicted AAA+ superfamily ATPase